MVRGKDGKAVEFGPKAHVALVDGYALLDDAQYESFHEGIQLEQSLKNHENRFDKQPDIVLADQLYANRKNRALLGDKGIDHAFKRIALPMNPNRTNKNIVANSNKNKVSATMLRLLLVISRTASTSSRLNGQFQVVKPCKSNLD